MILMVVVTYGDSTTLKYTFTALRTQQNLLLDFRVSAHGGILIIWLSPTIRSLKTFVDRPLPYPSILYYQQPWEPPIRLYAAVF